MENIMDLLNNKNRHLTKFFELNESELQNITDGNFDNLETFYRSREVLLEIINKIDGEINRLNENSSNVSSISDNAKGQILSVLREKNELVTSILSQDLQILSAIEIEKSRIIKDLSQVKTAKKAVRGYRNRIVSERLDEEV